jgi:hypothetical protein
MNHQNECCDNQPIMPKENLIPPDCPQTNRPPLGLRPKYIRDLERLSEVQDAIKRYWDAGMRIPIEWIQEYNELIAGK